MQNVSRETPCVTTELLWYDSSTLLGEVQAEDVAGDGGDAEVGRGAAEHALVADKWGQRSWGRCKSNEIDRLGKKVRPGNIKVG